MSNHCVSIEELIPLGERPIRKVGEHHVFVKGHNYKLVSETKIYRYMRLSTLLDMLFYGKMHIPNRLDFTDLREKNGLNKLVEELSSFSSVPSYREKQIMKRMEKDRQRALSLCVSCWTLDQRNNQTNDESFLMWRAYSKDDIVCRVGTTIGQLIDSVRGTSYDIIISDVDYKGEKEMMEYEDMVFRKSIYYEGEQEIRMVVLSDNKQGIDLSIDIGKLLDEIKISPFVPPVLGFFLLKGLKEWSQ